MKFLHLFIAVSMIEAKSEFCSFQNCKRCEIVLTNTNNRQFERFIPQCRKVMGANDCCQDYMQCDILSECIPRFRRYYR